MLAATDSPSLTKTVDQEQQGPVESGKKTRQWEAWTHEEEEKFFLALRQVGKDFEKITSQVATKNKDQVRHYYYRLIKRMNKLLSSDLSVDARNSKDVDAAMLCWWSLLEKHKCSSSKLHMKPRRLKAFVTALKQQRLKDRRKVKKKTKDPSPTSCVVGTNVVAAGIRKKSCTRTPVKLQPAIKQTTDNNFCAAESGVEQDSDKSKVNTPCTNSKTGEVEAVEAVDMEGQKEANLKTTSDMEATALKIKIQLFPVDDVTKTALEQEGHNPHLELTLKGSKSISSVLQHLSQKWGRCSLATGELRLYPYVAPASPRCWNSKDAICAADVYDALGKPPVFRLRYGWSQTDRNDSPPEAGPSLLTRAERSEGQCQPDSQELGCTWLNEKSLDGFGQRLWRDEDVLLGSSVDCLNVLVDSKGDASLTSSVWGGEETCDGFLFGRKEQIRDSGQKLPVRESSLSSILGCSEDGLRSSSSIDVLRTASSSDVLRSSSLDLYWADSLGALDGTFIQGQNLLLNGNSSLGGGISASLFPDSLDGFPRQA